MLRDPAVHGDGGRCPSVEGAHGPELRNVHDAIAKVQEVAGDDVPPTANPVPLEAHMRPDEAERPLTQAEALSGAPVSEDGMFVAPRILGEE